MVLGSVTEGRLPSDLKEFRDISPPMTETGRIDYQLLPREAKELVGQAIDSYFRQFWWHQPTYDELFGVAENALVQVYGRSWPRNELLKPIESQLLHEEFGPRYRLLLEDYAEGYVFPDAFEEERKEMLRAIRNKYYRPQRPQLTPVLNRSETPLF